jgi:hypothetical protein
MFRHLNDLRYARSLIEAIGLYIVYTLVGVIAIGILAGGYAVVTGNTGYEAGLAIGTVTGSIASLAISFLMLRAKGLLAQPLYLVLAVLTGASALLGGLILSMIFVAFLSTRQPVEERQPSVA